MKERVTEPARSVRRCARETKEAVDEQEDRRAASAMTTVAAAGLLLAAGLAACGSGPAGSAVVRDIVHLLDEPGAARRDSSAA
jgi:hypothetical protein